MSNAPLFCDSCHQKMNIQLIYSARQVAHMLNVPLSVVNFYMADGRLKFRYRLLSGQSLRRVVDYIQLWDFIGEFLPRPEDLKSTDLSKTKQAISRITEWHRRNAKTLYKYTAKRRAERLAAAQPKATPPDVLLVR